MVGKGNKAGKVALPPLAKSALDQYLVERGLPTTPTLWTLSTPLIVNLDQGSRHTAITFTRVRHILKRFFTMTAEVIKGDAPQTAEKLRHASPHWMRHTHATHTLARGADLTALRDNLRHTSVSTTSIYLHTDQVKRAWQMRDAFGPVNL